MSGHPSSRQVPCIDGGQPKSRGIMACRSAALERQEAWLGREMKKSGAQTKFMGATAGGACLTALLHGQNLRQSWGPGTVLVRERRQRQQLNGGQKQKKMILLRVKMEGRGKLRHAACHRYLARSESLRKWIARSF